jgi:polyisoprenoid-binding protein YceI
MKTKIIVLAVAILYSATPILSQQKIFTKSATIKFFSKAPLEDIEAISKTGLIVLDKASGKVEASMLLQSFSFEKALMQEHFNENYVESTKYPKASFKGVIENASSLLDLKKATVYIAKGELTLHGITKPLTASITLTPQANATAATTNFSIILADYNISIPALVKDKISSTVKVSINGSLEVLNR